MDSRPVSGYGTCFRGNDGEMSTQPSNESQFTRKRGSRADALSVAPGDWISGFRRNDGIRVCGRTLIEVVNHPVSVNEGTSQCPPGAGENHARRAIRFFSASPSTRPCHPPAAAREALRSAAACSFARPFGRSESTGCSNASALPPLSITIGLVRLDYVIENAENIRLKFIERYFSSHRNHSLPLFL